jgi:hypothetical protein
MHTDATRTGELGDNWAIVGEWLAASAQLIRLL